MAYLSALYSDDIDYELYFRECALEAKLKDQEFTQINILYEAADGEKKDGLFTRMLKSIKEFLAKLQENISRFLRAAKNSFGPELTVQDYLKSNAYEVRLKGDVEKITKRIQDEILQERKGVQMIAGAVAKFGKKTGVPIDQIFDARKIAEIVDNVNAKMIDDGPKVVSAAVSAAAVTSLTRSINDAAGLTSSLEESRRAIEKRREHMHDYRTQLYEAGGNKLLKAIEDLSFSVSKTASKAQSNYAAIIQPYTRFKYNLGVANQKEAKAAEKELRKAAKAEKKAAKKKD